MGPLAIIDIPVSSSSSPRRGGGGRIQQNQQSHQQQQQSHHQQQQSHHQQQQSHHQQQIHYIEDLEASAGTLFEDEFEPDDDEDDIDNVPTSMPRRPSLSSFADALEQHHHHHSLHMTSSPTSSVTHEQMNPNLCHEVLESRNNNNTTTTIMEEGEKQQHIILHLLLFMKHRSWKKKVMMAIVILSVSIVVLDFITIGYIKSGLNSFLEWMNQNIIAGFFAFILLFIIATLAFVPPAILTFGSGFVFVGALGMGWGIFVATVTSFVGASIGAIIAFFRARYMMRDLIKLFAQRYPIVKAIDKAIKRKGFRVMLLLRLCPLIPFNGMNYIGGITGVKWHIYTSSLIGILPTIFITVLIGGTAGSLAEDEGNQNQKVAQIVSMSIGCVLGLISILFIWYYAKREIEKEINDPERTLTRGGRTSSSSEIDIDDSSHSSSLAVHEGDYQDNNIHDEEWFWVWS